MTQVTKIQDILATVQELLMDSSDQLCRVLAFFPASSEDRLWVGIELPFGTSATGVLEEMNLPLGSLDTSTVLLLLKSAVNRAKHIQPELVKIFMMLLEEHPKEDCFVQITLLGSSEGRSLILIQLPLADRSIDGVVDVQLHVGDVSAMFALVLLHIAGLSSVDVKN